MNGVKNKVKVEGHHLNNGERKKNPQKAEEKGTKERKAEEAV
jgi:hypothetical protein